MKYICFDTETGEEIVTFSDNIDHDNKAWACKRDSEGIMVPISAGFVYNHKGDIGCFGESVTLGLVSREDIDTKILLKQLLGDT